MPTLCRLDSSVITTLIAHAVVVARYRLTVKTNLPTTV